MAASDSARTAVTCNSKTSYVNTSFAVHISVPSLNFTCVLPIYDACFVVYSLPHALPPAVCVAVPATIANSNSTHASNTNKQYSPDQ
eukprot:8542-Heterococcus_DN1.PRE.2